MNLKDFLKKPDAMTAAALARLIGVQDQQVRQWQHGYNDRKPSPENCVAIERATNGEVTRQELRPDDYWLIWPDLAAPNSLESGGIKQPATAQEAGHV